MAEYKVKYTLGEKEWIKYVKDVQNENEAVIVSDIENPDIPRTAKVEVELVSE